MSDQSDLARAIQDVTTHAQTIVREEIELAKAEVTEKATKLAKGAAVGAAAGVFVLAGLIYFLHAMAWLLYRLIDNGDNVWLGYAIVTAFLFLLATIAGFVAWRFFKGGSPPTPQMAIEEAQRVRDTIQSSTSSTTTGSHQ
jgi:hypothetical protein